MSNRNDLPQPSAPNFNQRLRETIQTYLGKQGNPLDRGITLRDLITNGIVKFKEGFNAGSLAGGGGALPIAPVAVDEVDLTPPPQPTGFVVSAAISHVFIEHDDPVYRQGHGHLRTRVYGAIVEVGDPLPTFDDAVEVGQFSGQVWAMPSNPSTTWRLWIEWETNDGVLSATPAGGTNGLEAVTGQDVAQLLAALEGQITEGALYQDLGARIDLIDGIGAGSVNARIQTEAQTLAAAINNNTAAIQTEATARATADGTLLAKYTVKVDVNGYVSGFGLASTSNNATPTSEFAVRADKFYIASPGGPGVSPSVPFIVRTTATTIGGINVPVGVYMNDAFIQNGTITNAKIANLAVDNAKIADLSADKLKAGSIAVGEHIQSTGYVAGSTGWRINGNGTAEFSGVLVRGTVIANAGSIGGITIASNAVRSGQTGFNSGQGFFLGSDGKFSLGNPENNRLTWDGSNLNIVSPGLTLNNGGATFSGNLNAAGGTFNGALSAATGTFSGALSAATGTFSGALTANAINAVDTINIAGNAVTVPVSTSSRTVLNIHTPSFSINDRWVDVLSLVTVASGGNLYIHASVDGTAQVYIGNSGSGFGELPQYEPVFARILVNGAEVSRQRLPASIGASIPNLVGSVSIVIQVLDIARSLENIECRDRSLFAIETKR